MCVVGGFIRRLEGVRFHFILFLIRVLRFYSFFYSLKHFGMHFVLKSAK